jgi:hypothetical protein
VYGIIKFNDTLSPYNYGGNCMQDEKHVTGRKELSTTEASQISGLSRNHITLLLRQGKLEGRNFDHRLWTVFADSLERYIATPHKSGPKGPRKKVHTNNIDIDPVATAHSSGE